MSARRLCFCAPPFAGHLNPLAALARGAQDAGYSVEVITGAAKVPTLRAAGLDAVALPALDGDALERIANTPHQVGSNPFRLAAQMRAAFAVMGEARTQLIDRWRVQPPDLVVADFIAVAAGLAADQVGVPWITAMRSVFALEGRSGPPAYLGGLGPARGPLSRLRNAAGRTAVRSGKDLLAWTFRDDLRRLGLPNRRRPDGSEAIYASRAILAMDMVELEFERDWPKALRFIGPISDNPEAPLRLNLPSDRPRVLVTLGTHLPWAKRGLVEAVGRLSARLPEASFIVSMGAPERASAEPVLRSGRITAYDFVPYMDHLPLFDAVVHHGGAAVACVQAGRPALVVPQDYDQWDYAARIAHHGLGFSARRLDSADAADKLRRLLTSPLPAVAVFAAHAARYRPVESFLAAVQDVLARPGAPLGEG